MSLTHFPHGVSSRGVPVLGAGADDYMTTGDVYFVHSGDGNDVTDQGIQPSAPFATLDYAIGQATADQKDIIFVMPGHDSTTTSETTVDKAGLIIIGLGTGKNRPKITADFSSAGDTIAVDSANVKIKNLYFVTPDASQNAAIDVNAADVTIENCLLDCGANFLDGITITASGDNAIIAGCEFRVTADGPNSAIRIGAAASGVEVLNSYFMGGNDSNAWDDAAIDAATSGGTDVVPTNTRISNNTFLYGVGVDINSAGTTGIIEYNNFGEGTLGSMLDPGALMCIENYEADAVDETGRAFPTGTAS